jgi:hypothetical protein
MSSKTKFRLLAVAGVLLLLAILVPVGFLVASVFYNPELRAKPEWSELQGVEFEWRDKSIESFPFFQQRDGYSAVCVLASDGKQKIWILLNPKVEPFYKQMPGVGDYRLTVGDLKKIVAFGSVQPQTMKKLLEHTF